MSGDERIIHDHLDGGADGSALRAWLAEDPAHVDELVRWSDLHWRLGEAMTDRRTRRGVVGARRGPIARIEPAAMAARSAGRRRMIVGATAALAAVLAIGGLIAAYRLATPNVAPSDAPNDAGSVLAVMGIAEGVVWSSEPIEPGDDVRQRTVAIDAGRLELECRGGATVSLIGPGSMVLRSERRAELAAGRIEVSVERGGEGFTVDAPHGVRVVDLGTRFVVVADERGVDVSVVEGRVELHIGGGQLELAAGESRLVTSDGAVLDGLDRLAAEGSLVAWYRFDAADEAAGRVINAAATGAPLNGAIVGGTSEADGGAWVDGSSVGVRAMRLTGLSGPHVRVAHDDRLNLATGGTIAMRVRLDDATRVAHLINKIDPSTHKPGFNLAWTGGAQPRVYLYVGERAMDSEPVTPPTGWFDLAVTWAAGGEAVFYIDGVRVSSAPVAGELGVNESDMLIGRASWTDDNPMFGAIETLVILSRPIEAARVTQLLRERQTLEPQETLK